MRHGRRGRSTRELHPGRSGRNHLSALAKAAEVPARRVEELLELVALKDAGEAARGRVLAGYAPAARPRRGAARRPARPHARRARQRARPAGDPLAARLPAHARAGGPRDPRLQPRPGRGRADRRRCGGHQQGPLVAQAPLAELMARSGGGMRVTGPDVGRARRARSARGRGRRRRRAGIVVARPQRRGHRPRDRRSTGSWSPAGADQLHRSRRSSSSSPGPKEAPS